MTTPETETEIGSHNKQSTTLTFADQTSQPIGVEQTAWDGNKKRLSDLVNYYKYQLR